MLLPFRRLRRRGKVLLWLSVIFAYIPLLTAGRAPSAGVGYIPILWTDANPPQALVAVIVAWCLAHWLCAESDKRRWWLLIPVLLALSYFVTAIGVAGLTAIVIAGEMPWLAWLAIAALVALPIVYRPAMFASFGAVAFIFWSVYWYGDHGLKYVDTHFQAFQAPVREFVAMPADARPILTPDNILKASCAETLRVAALLQPSPLDITQDTGYGCPTDVTLRRMVLSPDRNVLYFTFETRLPRGASSRLMFASLGRLDLRDKSLKWWTGSYPYGITRDTQGDNLYAAIFSSGRIAALDAMTLRQRWIIKAPGSVQDIAYDAKSDSLTAISEDCLSIEYDTVHATPSLVRGYRMSGGVMQPDAYQRMPYPCSQAGLAYAPEHSMLFVGVTALFGRNYVARMDEPALRWRGVGARHFSLAVVWVPSLQEFWSVDAIFGTVRAYAPMTGKTRTVTSVLTGMRRAAYDPVTDRVLMCQFTADRMLALDAQTGKVAHTYQVPNGCRDLLIDSVSRKAYIAGNLGLWEADITH